MHVDGGRLPNAVGTIFSLLDVTGVPVELGKHHVAGSGEGQTLERTHTNTHATYLFQSTQYKHLKNGTIQSDWMKFNLLKFFLIAEYYQLIDT